MGGHRDHPEFVGRGPRDRTTTYAQHGGSGSDRAFVIVPGAEEDHGIDPLDPCAAIDSGPIVVVEVDLDAEFPIQALEGGGPLEVELEVDEAGVRSQPDPLDEASIGTFGRGRTGPVLESAIHHPGGLVVRGEQEHDDHQELLKHAQEGSGRIRSMSTIPETNTAFFGGPQTLDRISTDILALLGEQDLKQPASSPERPIGRNTPSS